MSSTPPPWVSVKLWAQIVGLAALILALIIMARLWAAA